MGVRSLACALALVAATPVAACQGAASDPTTSQQDVDLPGVDTHDFTPREKHEFSTYVTQFPAPCPAVAVPIAQCVIEKRACPACLPAAQTIAKAVREGMAREQVEGLYKQRFDAASAKTIAVEGSPSRGPDGAPVTVVEFADFECPFCQHIAPELDALWQKRQTAVRFVYKFMPLPMHPHGESAARAAIAAQAQGKFWEMHDKLFANGEHLDDADILRLRGGHRPRPRPVSSRPPVAGDQGAPRCRSQARRRFEGEGDADDLHQRPRVRHEDQHRRVGRWRDRRVGVDGALSSVVIR